MKTAIVMSGGAAKGSIQWGALEELEKRGEAVHDFYGTSVGALNATGMAYLGLSGLSDIWSNLKKNSDILKFNWKTLGPIFGTGIYNTKGLRKIIDKAVTNRSPIANSTVCWVDVLSGKIQYGRSGDEDYATAIEASAAMPFIMCAIDGHKLDGGIREVSPLKKAIQDGADRIIVLLADPLQNDPGNWPLPSRLFRGLKMIFRAVQIMNHEVSLNDIKICLERNKNPAYKKIKIEVYAPKDGSVEHLKFEQPNIQRGRQQGRDMIINGPVLTSEDEVE